MNEIYSINGPVVKVKNPENFKMLEKVYVGKERLVGEVIALNSENATIQVYESTSLLKVNDEVFGTNDMLSVTLGPGIIGSIYDGIQRPLDILEEKEGYFLAKGSNVKSLNQEKLWDVEVVVSESDYLKSGNLYAVIDENELIKHKKIVPNNIEGVVVYVNKNKKLKVNETVISIKDNNGTIINLTLETSWPIKIPRPIKTKLKADSPLITGQRIIDSIFPIAKGGCAAIPGGFGAGKTMLQHQIAKWCNADIIVYVGCGERGNEMTQVLEEFKELIDPKTKQPLLNRTVLIANTSNMPVAAREASIYTGITIAEYYRDMGYDVAIMADSTSRWAEALREISGRLEELPAEEGFPAYLPSKIAQFYERAGSVTTLSDEKGSVTIIGAVSPQGGDFSEPVTQNTKRFVKTFWALDKNLSYARHFPSINWNLSYSDYFEDLETWYASNIAEDFFKLRNDVVAILNKENKLLEVVKLIGSDILADEQKLLLEISRVIRVGFLQQNAFNDIDTYVPFLKQYKMLKIIFYLNDKASILIKNKIPFSKLVKTDIFNDLIRIKYEVRNDDLVLLDSYFNKIDKAIEIVEAMYE